MVQAKTWVLKQHFEGFPKDGDFALELEELPEPKDGGWCMKTAFCFLSYGYVLFLLTVVDCCRSTCGSSVPQCGSLHAVSIHLPVLRADLKSV